jgi:hypothetical protein
MDAKEAPVEQEAASREKMVISAQQVLEDIRSGMDDEGFMVKYGLSFRQLQRLFRKMILGGYITPPRIGPTTVRDQKPSAGSHVPGQQSNI